ncbi:MAG: hypothetical protein K2W82_10225 [Candidatus Obscuribacterales bacterium]|nr:hypothetical protein [Candidatus Obscuribacterales bacterium]
MQEETDKSVTSENAWEMPGISVQVEQPKRKPSMLHKTLGMWIHPFTRFHRIPVSKRVWLYMAVMAAYIVLVNWITDQNFPTHVFKEAGTAAYGSVIMGLLLVFRTNSAYERWWEGRKLWGQLVNDSRNMCLKVKTFVPVSDAEKARLGELVISFAYALKHHLRGTTPSDPLPGLGPVTAQEAKNLPVYTAGRIYEVLMEWERGGQLDNFTQLRLDPHARAYMDITGACERIKNSPLALSYRAFMRQGITLNLIALPWYIVPELDIWWSIPVILIGSYFLIGLELIAEDIEDPFGEDGDDLPLDSICAGIRSTVSDILNLQKQQKFTRSFVMPRVDPLKDHS